jgi:hypothetical protein
MASLETQMLDKQQGAALSPYAAGTVLERVGVRLTYVEGATDSDPQQTPPVPFRTYTRSGEGPTQVTDDEDDEHLYE